jgi:hypothetical protein
MNTRQLKPPFPNLNLPFIIHGSNKGKTKRNTPNSSLKKVPGPHSNSNSKAKALCGGGLRSRPEDLSGGGIPLSDVRFSHPWQYGLLVSSFPGDFGARALGSALWTVDPSKMEKNNTQRNEKKTATAPVYPSRKTEIYPSASSSARCSLSSSQLTR